MTPLCKICNSETALFDQAVILGKHVARYYRCLHCGFIQTEEPFWLQEAYSSAITDSDIGLIARNIHLSTVVNAVLKILNPQGPLLDYGGGYGMFVRMMRDKGWDFDWYDEYCDNLFAKGHEMRQQHYEVVTSFELLEHLSNPLEVFEKLFSLSDTLICTTELLPQPIPRVKDWWYYATETGQHIAFYTRDSLQVVSNKFGRNLYAKHGVIIFSDKEIPVKKINFSFNYPRVAQRMLDMREKKSLLADDYFKLTGKNL